MVWPPEDGDRPSKHAAVECYPVYLFVRASYWSYKMRLICTSIQVTFGFLDRRQQRT